MSFDYNVDNYTIYELLAIISLDELSSTQEIIDHTNTYILKYKSEGNKPMFDFFSGIQTKLLLTIKPKNDTLMSIQDNEQEIIKKTPETMRVQNDSNNSFTVPVKQDKLNPTLENTTTRLINLDSQFRQSSGNDTSTDYTLDLSDPLTNVLSLKLYSIQIPFTWYVIDSQYNNNCFWITDTVSNPTNPYKITVDSGNYTGPLFAAELNKQIVSATSIVSGTYVTYNTTNGKITINLSGTHISNSLNYFTFFDFNEILETASNVNGTLGWLMGFREAVVNILTSGNVADCIIDLYGTKNLILIIDDFNQNHVNNGLISITESSKVLPLPKYYRPDLPYTIIPPTTVSNNDLTDFGEGSYKTYTNIPNMLPTSPRVLTQAQIYTINEIMKNRGKTVSYRIRAPTSPDIFAMIPMKHHGMKIGDFYIEFGGTLQINKRVYFGPVNIERLRIKLLDDKGNVINLNGVEWSVTLISENLYQY
jgi:hypothetical protein